jgi:hypothetical protein
MAYIGYGIMLVGIVVLIWSLLRKSVSIIGLGLLVVGFVLELLLGH